MLIRFATGERKESQQSRLKVDGVGRRDSFVSLNCYSEEYNRTNDSEKLSIISTDATL